MTLFEDAFFATVRMNGEPPAKHRHMAGEDVKEQLRLAGIPLQSVRVETYNNKVDTQTWEGGTSVCFIEIYCAPEVSHAVERVIRERCNGTIAGVVHLFT